MQTITIAILIIALVYLGIALYKTKKYIQTQDIKFNLERTSIRKDAQFRSAAVNWGKTIEHFVPFMPDFPVPAEDVVFLGMPIDYVGFTNTKSKTKCEVHFVEVKSGNAFLMGKQKNIKKAIQEGRVYWHEVTVEGNAERED
jgi:predicted Holliday junction resolvase-like endonuclease|tara:strand:+ start:4140 stop:4565 length:426 start_codon:yes stop_codon:yes gene_type:complete